MGFAFSGYCHPTISEAAQRACADGYPVNWGNETSFYSVMCGGVNPDGALQLTKHAEAQAPITYTLSPTFPACDWQTYPSDPLVLSPADGALVAASIVGLWLTAWGFRVLIQMIRERDPDE